MVGRCGQGRMTKKSLVAEEVDGQLVAWERAGRLPVKRRHGGREVSDRWHVVRGGSAVVSVGEDVVAGHAVEEMTGGHRWEEIQVVV